jgi:outer membrane lipoprotein-sorting protein
MKPIARAAVTVFAFSILISGCSLMPIRRRLPVPKAPDVVQTVTPQELVTSLNRRWDALETLKVTVEIQATEFKAKENVSETFGPSQGWVLLRKPEMLRVAANYLGLRALDMASDGKTFTILFPLKSKAIEGSDDTAESVQESSDPIYNLRPQFFIDAIFVQGLQAGDHYSVTANTETVEDAAKKHLLAIPEYILNVARLNPGSPQMTEVRVVTIHRDDLLPYKQDIYDKAGDLQTEVQYQGYRDFGGLQYPSYISIRCPIAHVEIDLTIDQVAENTKLTDGQFQLRLPPGIKIQHLN